MMVARLADAGNWPLLISAAVQSITQDYSWAPALVPGLLMAVTEPTSRAIYTFALLALYAAPAAFALAVLARDCARGAGLARDAQPAVVLGLGVAAVFVAYPAAFAVAARGMPDVGGLVLVGVRAQARRAACSPDRPAARPRRTRSADDPPCRARACADALCDVRLPALVRVRRRGNRRHAGARGPCDCAEERRGLSLERRRCGGARSASSRCLLS